VPPIPTHLGKRLAQQDLVALLDKVPHGVRVLENVAGRKALVRLKRELLHSAMSDRASLRRVLANPRTHHVKEREVLLLLDQLGQLAPLRLGRVDTRGVLRISTRRLALP
jgi:hypothetical protein